MVSIIYLSPVANLFLKFRIINLFYVGLILIYCILHAGPLNLMVFLGMLVVANLMGMLIK
ncbi:hypothetical protein DKZ29_10230 [Limosilactobacillus reuteri]|nr:hypothetical protein DKZ24_10405 [Limosilactobacillus reuteri]PWT43436.1 hypothetical protein DKZ25_09600 [Limosilactobacillus reuteri]PWT52242.1 hypothetical protein DKZ31_10015 [Limosilactobacillus reuteri]PWT56918.1 hypothetical protein DKZ29_10230 [Limosilactobacillus reuteri]PWT57455.1 hypothetical protein DKZ30_10385 [Limosilactobacillus reuteri]